MCIPLRAGTGRRSRFSVARLLSQRSLWVQSIPLYQRSLSIKQRVLGPDDPSVATSLNNLGELYRIVGRYAEAEPLFCSALTIMENSLGRTHPSVAICISNLALLYMDKGQYEEAEPL